ncbi:MAG: hypothetical protein IPO08_22835 [Xanthomonadales bacterium]|nr:hypothetical protein [Xanthomonadales bacterium]
MSFPSKPLALKVRSKFQSEVGGLIAAGLSYHKLAERLPHRSASWWRFAALGDWSQIAPTELDRALLTLIINEHQRQQRDLAAYTEIYLDLARQLSELVASLAKIQPK